MSLMLVSVTFEVFHEKQDSFRFNFPTVGHVADALSMCVADFNSFLTVGQIYGTLPHLLKVTPV